MLFGMTLIKIHPKKGIVCDVIMKISLAQCPRHYNMEKYIFLL